MKEMWDRMNEGYYERKSAEKSAEKLTIKENAKKYQYEGVISVPTLLYGAESWGMRSAESRKVNVLPTKCLRSLVGVSRIYTVTNE